MPGTLTPSGLAGGGAPCGDTLLPALSVVTLQYHTLPPEKLVARTVAGLMQAGIPLSALGRVTGIRSVTVTGCIVLNAMAREHLPSQLGGVAASFAGSPATHDLIDTFLQHSPLASRHHKLSPFSTLRVTELESTIFSMSVESPVPPRAPSGLSLRGVDMAREHQHIMASAQCVSLTSDAIAILSSYPIRFPLIYRALLKACGGGTPAVLSDFSLLALVPAVQAARQQEWGLDMMRTAVVRDATSAGEAGTEAVQAFADHTFDLNASRALRDGVVSIEVSPLDVCLGVLPLAQLGLHLWLHHHSFSPVDSTVLLELARSVSFASGGRLDPTAGLALFMPVWAQTLGAELDIPHAEVHCLLVRALGRDALLPGGGHFTASIQGTLMTWTAFAYDRAAAWETEGSTRHVHTIEELETLVDQLWAFGRACGRVYRAAGNVRSPTVGGRSLLLSRVAVASSPPDPEAPPPAPVPVAAARRHLDPW